MSSSANHNYELIEYVADGLGEAFLTEVAFVGGCTTAMLVTDVVVLGGSDRDSMLPARRCCSWKAHGCV